MTNVATASPPGSRTARPGIGPAALRAPPIAVAAVLVLAPLLLVVYQSF